MYNTLKSSWNPVFNLIVKIKNEYYEKYNKFDYDSYLSSDYNNTIDYWVDKLGNEEYKKIFKYVQINQKNNFVLIRYARYSSVTDGDIEITFENIWDVYNGFYRECRSVVLDIVNNEIVLAPFRKFRNVNECEENSLTNIKKRIESAKCIEVSNKLDGSMQSSRFYNNEIVMAGSQSIDKENSWRLEDGYRMLLSQDNYCNMLKTYPNYTFIFEYISLKDAHIVKYTKEQEGLYLIGVRDVNTGRELAYKDIFEIADKFDVLKTKTFDKSFDEVISELDDKTSSEAEGFVINIDGFKVKVKYNDYCNMHGILSTISSVNVVIKSIADDNYDDMLSKVPNAYIDRVTKTADVCYKYIQLMNEKTNEYYIQAPKENKKEFMIWVTKNVPKKYAGYVIQKFLGREINYLKSGSINCPSYIKLKQMQDEIEILQL